MARKRLLVFDPYVGGHHPRYIGHLLRYWQKLSWPVDVTLGVPQAMIDLDSQLAELVSAARDHVRLEPVTQTFGKSSLFGLATNDIRSGLEVRRILLRDRHDLCLMMYFDHMQLATASLLRGIGATSLAGVLFRPEGVRPTGRKRVVLRAALANPRMSALFVLDGNAVGGIREIANRATVRWLPDGIDDRHIAQSPIDVAPSTATRFLMAGSISRRKGIHLLGEALRLLEPTVGERIELVVAGPHEAKEADLIRQSLDNCRSRVSRLVVDDRYLSADEIQEYIGSSHVVLVPYVAHVGSSNILVHSAATPRPVIGTRSGLVGNLIRTNNLGDTTDADTAQALAAAIERAVRDGVANFDTVAALNFARLNSATSFATAITETLIAGATTN